MTTRDIERILEENGYNRQDGGTIMLWKHYIPTPGKPFSVKSYGMEITVWLMHTANAARVDYYRDNELIKTRYHKKPGAIINAIKTTLDYNGYTF